MTIDPLELDVELRDTPYEVLRLLGRGAMGEVFEVRHRRLRRLYVVKVLRDPMRKDLEDRLRLEAHALAALRHPNLLEVVDLASTASGRPFIVAERLVGETLGARLRRGPAVTTTQALRWVADALAGLAAAHRAGLVHRDVKLENLFLCEPCEHVGERVKVIDFGIVKVVSPRGDVAPLTEATAQGLAVGTPATMAPEQWLGGTVDQRADLFSLGVVLLQLLTGDERAAPAPRWSEGALARAGAMPAPALAVALGRLPPDLARVVRRATEPSPDHRFQSASEMRGALERLLPPPVPPSLAVRRGGAMARWPAPGRPPAAAPPTLSPAELQAAAKVISFVAGLLIILSLLVLLGAFD